MKEYKVTLYARHWSNNDKVVRVEAAGFRHHDDFIHFYILLKGDRPDLAIRETLRAFAKDEVREIELVRRDDAEIQA